MKNLLLIIHKLSNGGAERAITLLADSLKDKYNITIVTFDNRMKEYETKVDVIDLKIPESRYFLKKIINIFIRAKKIKKIKKQLNINCSISFLSGPNIVNCLSRKDDKIIISIRNMQSKLKKDFFRDIVNQITLKKSDIIVTVSNDVKDDLQKSYKVDQNKIITIPNMVNINKIEQMQDDEIEEKELFLSDNIKIINIGRLIYQKGQWHLIKAMKIVTEKYKNVNLIILGRGELEKKLQELIHKLNLQDNIYLLNFKTNPYKYLKNSDIFVSTSLYEGMSNVILEAMACGLPIIATDCKGGTKEIIENKYGILIPNFTEKYDITEKINDEEHNLAEKIIELIKDEEERKHYIKMSNIRIKDFEIKEIKKRWMDVIKND